jgi:hypothetical protein
MPIFFFYFNLSSLLTSSGFVVRNTSIFCDVFSDNANFFNLSPLLTSSDFVVSNTSNFCDVFSPKSYLRL